MDISYHHKIPTKMKLFQKKDPSVKSNSCSSNPNHLKWPNFVLNPIRVNNEMNSTATDSYFCQNDIINNKNLKILDSSNLKNKDNILNKLLMTFGDKNALCNFSIFEKNVDINMDLDKKIIDKITLYEYFDIFVEGSCHGVSVPFLDQKKNINYNIFNPTLSSMNMVIHRKNIKNNIKGNLVIDNFAISPINDDFVKIFFDEKNPHYNREVIGSKIKNMYKILNKKKILLKDINKEKSYFLILWTPTDTNKIKSSFLSVYSFDFKLVGTLIKNIDEFEWFRTFTPDLYSVKNKDFKQEYYINMIKVQNFLKKCNDIGDEGDLNFKIFSQDYRRFIYNT